MQAPKSPFKTVEGISLRSPSMAGEAGSFFCLESKGFSYFVSGPVGFVQVDVVSDPSFLFVGDV